MEETESTTASDKNLTIALDIESLLQASERCSGSPKMTKALSRKWSYRLDRCTSIEEEDPDQQQSKKIIVKVNSQLEPLKQSLITNKTITTSPITLGLDTMDGRNKRFNRFMTINPRNILFIFATASSIGTMILIFFTIAINRTT